MRIPTQQIGVAAITENLLKRKWSVVILQNLKNGIYDPCDIVRNETEISPKVMSERLRTMVRYGLIDRFPRPAPSNVIEYRLTALGRKILEMIDSINTLDQQLRDGLFNRRAILDEMPDHSDLGERNGAAVTSFHPRRIIVQGKQ